MKLTRVKKSRLSSLRCSPGCKDVLWGFYIDENEILKPTLARVHVMNCPVLVEALTDETQKAKQPSKRKAKAKATT